MAGPSGSGKSTILNLIGCIDVATSGIVEVTGEPTETLSDRRITALRPPKLALASDDSPRAWHNLRSESRSR